MWKLALEVGRQAIDAIAGEDARPASKRKPAKAAKAAKATPKSSRKPK
jgi:hypothetical protein